MRALFILSSHESLPVHKVPFLVREYMMDQFRRFSVAFNAARLHTCRNLLLIQAPITCYTGPRQPFFTLFGIALIYLGGTASTTSVSILGAITCWVPGLIGCVWLTKPPRSNLNSSF